jgi:hypothetical protein
MIVRRLGHDHFDAGWFEFLIARTVPSLFLSADRRCLQRCNDARHSVLSNTHQSDGVRAFSAVSLLPLYMWPAS